VIIAAALGALNDEIRGDLTVGELEHYGLDEVRAHAVVVTDEQGREVIRAESVRAVPDLGALWNGTIRVSRAELRGGEVTLYVSGDRGQNVSLVDSFMPANPSPVQGPPPPHILVDGITLHDVLVRGDVPGFRDQRYEHVRIVGRVETVGRAVRFSVFEGRGVMTGPYHGRTNIDRIVGRFSTDLENEGLRFFATARRGDDRVRAQIVLTRPDLEAAPIMDLRARAEPVRISTLREMNVAPGLENVEGTVRGRARLWGSTDDLELWGDLTSMAGRVIVRGRLPAEGTLHIEATTDALALRELVPVAPRTTVAGRVGLDLEPSEDGSPTRRLHADVSPLTIAGVAIPSFTLEGILEDDALVIEDLDATHAGGETLATGRVGFDGSLDVHVRADLPDIGADPNVARHARGAHGSLFAELDIDAGPRAENLRAEGRLSMRGARYGSVRADRLDVRGRAGGAMPAPELRLEGTAGNLRMGDLAFARARVTIEGGPEGYTIDAEAIDEASGTEVRLAGRATSTDEGIRLRAEDALVNVGDGPWRADLDLRFRAGELLVLDPLLLTRGSQRIAVRGTYRFSGADDLDVELGDVDLAQFRRLAPEALEGLAGRVDGNLELRGDLDTSPQGRVALRVRGGAYRGLRGVDGRVELDLTGDRLDTDVALDLGDAGRVTAQGPIRVPPSALVRDPERAIGRAVFDRLRVRAENVDIAPVLAAAGLSEDIGIAGRITTDAELTGSARRPDIRDAILVLDRILLDGWDPFRAKLRLTLAEHRMIMRHVWLADGAGELATGEGDLPFSLDDVPEDLPAMWRTLRSQPWAVSLRVAQRTLDSWPTPNAEAMPRGLAGSASITAGGDGQALTADFDAALRWVEAASDEPCAANLRPLALVRGRLEGDVVLAEASGFFGGEREDVRADIAAVLPLDEWVQQGGVGEFPSTEIALRLLGTDMGDVPWLCGYGRGPMYGRLTAKDLLTGRSVVGATVDLPRFAIWETVGDRGQRRLSDEYRMSIRAGSSPERDALTACAVLGQAGTEGTPGERCREVDDPADGEMIARLRVPVAWAPGSLLPEYVEDARISSFGVFNRVHVAPVLTLIPGIISGDAIVDGRIRVAGPWEDMQLGGALDLSEGHVQIQGLGQHLFDIRGHLDLREHEVIFPFDRPLVAWDAGGKASLYGRVEFEGLIPSEVWLQLSGDEFPIRNEGLVLAWLTGDAQLTGTITERETDSRITSPPPPARAGEMDFDLSTGRGQRARRALDVRLPDQSGASLQSLEEHSQIQVVGELRRRGADGGGDSYPIRVRIDADDAPGFWVRRTDFSAQIRALLTAVYVDGHLSVGGEAEIQQGIFEIFGKRFELQRDSLLSFDPLARELNPTVNITAIYEIPGRTAATVTVRVTGTLTNPIVEFQSTETNDRAEIIALLVAGGRRQVGTAERSVSEQATSFLAGITAGILTLGLRQEFGDLIPMLAIESEGVTGTRVRIGFQADDLIPDVLREVVTGMYIEGFVSGGQDTNAAGTSSGSGGVGGGVTIELTFPRNFLFRGTWVPVDNGSADLLYEF
jgi:hypothetical protein